MDGTVYFGRAVAHWPMKNIAYIYYKTIEISKPIFHHNANPNAKSFALGPRVGLDPQCVALHSNARRYQHVGMQKAW